MMLLVPSARQLHARLARAAGVLGLSLIAACAPDDYVDLPLVAPTRSDALAPFEAADWPAYLKRLALPAQRNYVILSYLPTKRPFDLSSPTAARRSLASALLDPATSTKIGHTIVGWQCGAQRGMASMTGAGDELSVAMFTSGWGAAAALSTYPDGRLYPEGQHRAAHLDTLASGGGMVTAVEVPRAECEALRARLARFVTHPNAPATKFGLLPDPRRNEGGGCLSFAFMLAEAAGVMRPMWPAMQRDVAIHAGMIGTGTALPPGVVPYRAPVAGCCDAPRAIPALLGAPWAAGGVVDELRIPDNELVIAGLVELRRGIDAPHDWRFGRVIRPNAPETLAVRRAALGWRTGYKGMRIADPDGVDALVLERR